MARTKPADADTRSFRERHAAHWPQLVALGEQVVAVGQVVARRECVARGKRNAIPTVNILFTTATAVVRELFVDSPEETEE